ncbi:peptidase U32 family protein [Ottowia thiooxydans]|uniref:Collagenase-like PrtC family protease n=1 Tax=Ottowia thiooxydans TaxID=219182 RepID=A0ABV2QGZ7_9BURK
MPHSHELELLAPARDADIGIEAIRHGADAVYIGGPGFGARASAGNSVADIARLTKYAHRFNSRIFVTLNTILRDDELEGARRMAWDVYEAGADALIIQDMGLLELDLPPIQLHASTQTDIRTPEKARFLQDVGFSQIVLARELSLAEIAGVRDTLDPDRCTIEFFIHGALCVAFSGQCYISHAHTGRSANRGECSQACRLPYQVLDAQGRFVAHDAHVLSMKDNNQSLNLGPLIDAGVRSFKIEGRYKDMAYVKNITAHYRKLLDDIQDERPELARASSGRVNLGFTPDPLQNFNREFTDYFVNGRKEDIGAFDTPKNPGQPIGFVSRVAADHFEMHTDEPGLRLSNGDGLCYWNQQKELVGAQTNRVENIKQEGVDGPSSLWRVFPKDAMSALEDLRKGTVIHRNRSMDWVRTLEKKSSDRRMGVWVHLSECDGGLQLALTDEDGHTGQSRAELDWSAPKDEAGASLKLRESLSRLGETDFAPFDIQLALSRPWFVPASTMNALRREAVGALESARAKAWERLPRAQAVSPPVPYPDDTLSYLANVFNHKAHDFYSRHGVKVIDAAYESQQEEGEVSLMITKHCVRFSLSLCPKQAKGVIGVKGTIKAEPLQLVNGKEKLTLRFDCKPCEMHVVGKIKRGILAHGAREAAEHSLVFYKKSTAN